MRESIVLKYSILDDEFIQKLLKEELIHLILQKALIADIFLEKLFTKIRFEILLTLDFSNKDILKKYFHFIASLAEQCWLNEYIYIQSEKEIKLINKFEQKIENDNEINEIEIAILACYMPLNKSKIITKKLLDYESTNILFNDLINIQIKEPLKEKKLVKSITTLEMIDDIISMKVRGQYEEHPYPRWRYTKKPLSRNFFKKINSIIAPNKINYNNKFNNPNILVAGCGTGTHPISSTSSKNSNILAVDLSLTSLVYAKRKTEELDIKNIKYIQADILQLKKLNKKFDIIESAGTIHHMMDPLKGLKALLDILEPHGFMMLGLYSETARKHIVKAREFIKEKNYKNTIQDIKICRQDIIKQEEDPLMKKITQTRDFYSTSGTRDLLFHVQEHRFTIPQISKMLKDFNLEFLGFESTNPAIKIEYSKLFPNDKDNTSLDNWHQFELNNPDTFIGMYQFWVRKI